MGDTERCKNKQSNAWGFLGWVGGWGWVGGCGFVLFLVILYMLYKTNLGGYQKKKDQLNIIVNDV